MVGLIGQITVKRPNSGNFPGPGRGVQAIFRAAALLIQNPVPAEISHVAVDICQGHTGSKVQINIQDTDSIQRQPGQGRIAGLLEIPEKVPQIQEIFVNRASGVGFDGFVVRQEIPQDWRRFRSVICHIIDVRSHMGGAANVRRAGVCGFLRTYRLDWPPLN